MSSSTQEKQKINQQITPPQKKTIIPRKQDNLNSIERQNRYEVLKESDKEEQERKNKIEENAQKTTHVVKESSKYQGSCNVNNITIEILKITQRIIARSQRNRRS